MGQLNMLLGAVDVPGGVLNSSSMGPTWRPNLDPDGFIYPGNPLAGHMKPALPRRKVSAPETLELQELFPVSVYARAMLWLGLLHGAVPPGPGRHPGRRVDRPGRLHRARGPPQ